MVYNNKNVEVLMVTKREYNHLNIFISNGLGTVGNGTFGSGLIEGKDFSGSIKIPKKLDDGTPISAIYKWAFKHCIHLKSVIIEARITVIPQDGFYGCYALEYINIPSSVHTIDICAFSMYPYYSNVTLVVDFEPSNKLKNVNFGAFEWNINTTIFFRQTFMPSFHSDAFKSSSKCNVYGPKEGMNFGVFTTQYAKGCDVRKQKSCVQKKRTSMFYMNTVLLLYYKG